jgi:uncharacterized protein (DUF1015 family)
MAIIKPFKAIRPNPFYADQLVLTKPQAESVSGDNHNPEALLPLKDLLETGARLRPETPEGQEAAFRDINDTLRLLIEKDRLHPDENPSLYIYEVEHRGYTQTGIWALTQLPDDHIEEIKTHELTFDESVRRLKNYRENTGLEGNPILLTYAANQTIDKIIVSVKARQKHSTLGNSLGVHRLWKIEDEEIQQQLVEVFATIGTVYLADGHHRLESASKLARKQRDNGLPVYNAISSLYMADNQLRIQEYDRIVIPEHPVDKVELFKQLLQNFYLREASANHPVQPREPRKFGMYIQGEWYHLMAKRHICENQGIADNLDAAILQAKVLAPLFGINDPRTSPHLKCIGGGQAMDEILTFIAAHPEAIVFTICPMTVEQLTDVADAGEILPPKSTWIDPKVPYGLLLHLHR